MIMVMLQKKTFTCGWNWKQRVVTNVKVQTRVVYFNLQCLNTKQMVNQSTATICERTGLDQMVFTHITTVTLIPLENVLHQFNSALDEYQCSQTRYIIFFSLSPLATLPTMTTDERLEILVCVMPVAANEKAAASSRDEAIATEVQKALYNPFFSHMQLYSLRDANFDV